MGGRMRATTQCAGRDVPDLVVPELELLVRTPQYRPWTPEEDAVVRAYYGRVPVAALGGHLGRTADSVGMRAHRLGSSVPRLPCPPRKP